MKDIIEKLSYKSTYERMHIIQDYLDGVGVPYYRSHIQDGVGNIHVDFRKDEDAPYYMFCAHFDVVEGSSGANDNASGIAQLLNLIRKNVFAEINAYVVFSCFEEQGSLGCYRILDSGFAFGDIGNIKGAVNVDTCGWGDNVYYANRKNAPVFDVLENIDGLVRLDGIPRNDGDAFLDWGVPAITIMALSGQDEAVLCETKCCEYSSFELGYEVRSDLPICNTIHCGVNDNADIIDYDIMRRVESILCKIINLIYDKMEE